MLALEVPSVRTFAGLSLDQRAEDDLKSLMIVGLETAIDQGLSPHKALSIVFKWAADECARLKDEAAS